jgi:hypothetical protein
LDLDVRYYDAHSNKPHHYLCDEYNQWDRHYRDEFDEWHGNIQHDSVWDFCYEDNEWDFNRYLHIRHNYIRNHKPNNDPYFEFYKWQYNLHDNRVWNLHNEYNEWDFNGDLYIGHNYIHNYESYYDLSDQHDQRHNNLPDKHD